MTKFLIAAALLIGFNLHAEEKTCEVKGMHCEDCTTSVKAKVCGDMYSTCEVKIVDAKKKMGSLRIVTKEATAKIDEKALKPLVADTGYTLEKCTTKKM